MSMPFDATLKTLCGAFPADILAAFDRVPTGAVRLLNIDLSTVTTAADLVVGLGEPLEEIIHIDFQSSASATKHADILTYNALLFGHYRVPVHSMVLLLRPTAARANLSGTVTYAARPDRGRMGFEYELVRLWQLPAERLLSGGYGVLPLAILGRLPDGADEMEGLKAVAGRLIERLDADRPERARHLLTAAFVLTGLSVNREQARQVFAGVRAMRDSDTYLAILDEGREQQARDFIVRLAAKRLRAPDAPTVTRIEGITDLERLNRMFDRLSDAAVASWDDLLGTP